MPRAKASRAITPRPRSSTGKPRPTATAWHRTISARRISRAKVVERNDAEALRLFNLAAEQDVAAAQNTLGAIYCGGDKRPNPIKIDDELCDKWLKSAVALGNEDAKSTMLYLTKKAAEDGDTKAMNNLGAYYIQGFGTKPDVQQGLEWLTKAGEAGVKQSQYTLMQLYEKGGYGVEADVKKAAYWKAKFAK
jgi:TPR repeat protein